MPGRFAPESAVTFGLLYMSKLTKALREFQLNEITRTQHVDRRGDSGELSLNLGPTCSRKNQNRELSAGHILLVTRVLVRSDEGSKDASAAMRRSPLSR